MRKFVLDPTNFNGIVLTVLNDEGRSVYGGETLEELRTSENNPNLQALTEEEFWNIYKEFEIGLCKGSLTEITEEEYWDACGEVPPEVCPTKYAKESFIHGEPLSGSVRGLYFKKGERYFMMYICADLPIEYIKSEVKRA